MWHNKYIGIPYVEKGRTTEGCDCWGLVRLIYKDEYNIDLPSFAEEYIPKDVAHISELVHQYNEGWQRVDTPVEGTGVLFNILGHASHMGVMIDDTNFIHCIRGAEASIASIKSPRWAKRVEGFYKYVDKSSEVFKEEPHPLAVAPLTIEIPEGFTVREALNAIVLNNRLPERLKKQLVLFIDGEVVLEASDRVIKAGQKLEYKLLPADDNTVRTVAFVGLVVFAAPAAAAWAGTAAVSAAGGVAALGAAGAAALSFGVGAIATMATMAIGMQLINAIFPVRQPDMPTSPGDPGTSNPQLMLTGGRNESRAYGNIPIVLGQYRFIAPVAANTYSQIDTDTVYLRTLLCWGYGDVLVDDIRIGPTVISEYDEVVQYTDGNTLSTDIQTFNNIKNIYGTDTTQIYPNTELLYTNSESDWVYRNIVEDVTDINISLHFPEGLRGMYITGQSAGSIFAASFTGQVQIIQLDDNLNEIGTWRSPNTSIAPKEFKLTNSYNAEYSSNAYDDYTPRPKYTWSRLYILNGVLNITTGPAFGSRAETSVGNTRWCRADENGIVCWFAGSAATFPPIPTGAIPFFDILMYSYSASGMYMVESFKYNNVYQPAGGSFTGGEVSSDHATNNPTLYVTPLVSTTIDSIVNYGASGEEFYCRKDAFSVSILFNGLPKGKYKVRARRTNSSEAEPSSSTRLYHRTIFQAITGTIGTAPVVIPKDCSLALTALKIKATDQLNGSLEGVNALVTSVCLDYISSSSTLPNVSTINGSTLVTVPATSNGVFMAVGDTITGHAFIPPGSKILNIVTVATSSDTGFGWLTFISRLDITISNAATGTGIDTATLSRTGWIKQATRNPASLLRHILQHPANAQRITDAEVADKIDLPALEEWHTYCKTNGFNYDAVLTERRSLLEVMKDVAAAGRASPILSNGKWSVIIDKPRTTVVQQFSPHNSWDFEATKILPTIPHALRVPFVNAKQEFQTEELVVYNDIVRTISATSTIGSPNITVSTEAWANINVGAKVVSSTKIPTGKAVIDKFPPNTLLLENSIGITTGTALLEINTKYTSENAELYETISLPGVTDSSACYKHARFHLAQARLRPEFYSINADIEHIVCTRGDLVRVVYDTPMWGIGSSRIDTSSTVASTTTIFFDDPVVLTAGNSYTVRIRSYDGSNSTHVTSVIPSTAEYTSLSITPALTVEQRESGNLILIGEIAKDSAELIVISIEPSSNLTAKLTLVDYSPEVYSSDTELIPEFNTKITRPSFTARNFITLTPVINVSGIKSDESVMELSGTNYIYKIKVPFIVPNSLPKNITHIESRICLTNDTSKSWRDNLVTPITLPSISILDVVEGLSYSIQSRYISSTGYSGPWSTIANHVVVGKTTPPASVTGFSANLEYTTGKLLLKWLANTEIDIKGYEVRTDTNWGNSTNLLFSGNTTTCSINAPTTGVPTTYYIKAIDYNKLYSLASSSVSYTLNSPNTYSGSITYTYADTSTTASTITFNWAEAPIGLLKINTYVLTLTRPGSIISTYEVTGLTFTTQANWVGDATLTIKSKDILGNISATNSSAATITKARPAAPAAISASNFTVVDAQVYLDWADVSKTLNGLPVAGYEIRKNNINWGVQDTNLVWRGSVSSAVLKNIVSGTNTWYVNTFDTDNVYALTGTTASFSATTPNIATGLTATFNNTLSSVASVIISWVTPSTTAFPVSKFRVKLTRPDLTFITDTIDANTWTISADWVGNATLTIISIDSVGNESATSASLIISKLAPNTPGVITKIVQQKTINLSWPNTTNTTLPVAGYEIRSSDTDWGSSGFIWKGSVSSADMQTLIEGNNTWYLKAYDTSGKYSTTAQSTTQNIVKPGLTTINSAVFDTTAAIGSTVTITWTGNTQTFNIDYYNVSITRNAITTSAVVSGNTWNIPVDWTGTATFKITAVDTFGLASLEQSYNIVKTAPIAPSTFTVTPSSTGITLAWPNGTAGSLPIIGYELRATGSTPGGTDFIWKGSANSVEIRSLVLGNNTWDLWVFDTDNRYSTTAKALSYTATNPSICNSLTANFDTSITNATATFTWIKPSTSVFGISKYNVSLVTTNPVRTLTSSRDTTDWTVPADWIGIGTFSVTATDNLGFTSTVQTINLTKSIPNQPGVLSSTVTVASLDLDWLDTTKTSLPIAGYELRTTDANWGSTGYYWKGSSSSTLVDLTGTGTGTTLTWYLKAFDTDNRYSSSARSYSYTVLAPVNTATLTYLFEDTNLTSATITLNWTDTLPVFGLKHYEISGALTTLVTSTAGSPNITVVSTKGLKVGDTITASANIPIGTYIVSITNNTQIVLNTSVGITSGTSISTTFTNYRYSNSTTITVPADWLGDKIFTVKTVDLLNNKSTGTQVTATKSLPGAATNFRAQVIDNTVLLYWNMPSITTLPISHARIKKGATWATAELIGDKSGTFTTVTELQGGTYTYWVAIVDTDNNESTPTSLGITVSSPPDYIFNAEWYSTFTGTLSNALKEGTSIIMPVDTVETFAGHFTTRAWSTPTDQVNAGYPVYIQPGLTSGYYEEVFDFGTILGSSQISVSLSGTPVAGTSDVSVTISTSSDGISYPTVYTNTTSAFGTSFRYIKVRVSVSQITSGSIYSLNTFTVRLDAKQKTDSGTSTMVIGGAQPQGNVSQDYVSLWVPGSLPTTTFTLNGTSNENSITSQAGPGGYIEPIWNCIDYDVASDADGGWNTVPLTANTTKGHLFAVFVKTSNNSGATYYGPSTDYSISSLAGVSTNNPYFLGGIDLPTNNTWYLLVGYVHEVGYGTTDTGISGVYNLSGTKVAAGAEFKFNSGTTVSHRCYHYYNTTGSLAIVQSIARPIILECATADAASTISYILQCATGYGKSVDFNQQFIDITSIIATPQGTLPATPVVDFKDIPNPTRFNIFNYNSSGSLVGGNVSWTTRGY